MSTLHASMVNELKSTVVPLLRVKGFRGSLPHFRRPHAKGIDLLTFQFDRWGGGFVIEIACCPPEGATMDWGEHVLPNKVTAHHLNERHRLQPREGSGREDWFRFDDGNFYVASQQVISLLPVAEQWWSEHA